MAEGFYANRTDFIRSAIRAQLATRAAAVDQTVARRTLTLGTLTLTRRELEELQRAGRTVEIRVLGLATIAPDVSPEPALATILGRRGARRLPGEPGGEGRPRPAHRLTPWREGDHREP